jgi:hypothetical protein
VESTSRPAVPLQPEVPFNPPISTRDLISWSFQIARGMDYLATKKVLCTGYYILLLYYIIMHKVLSVHFIENCNRSFTVIWPPGMFCWPTTELPKWPISEWLVKCITKEIMRGQEWYYLANDGAKEEIQ